MYLQQRSKQTHNAVFKKNQKQQNYAQQRGKKTKTTEQSIADDRSEQSAWRAWSDHVVWSRD